VLLTEKILFLFALSREKENKSNGGFTLYAAPFQGSLISPCQNNKTSFIVPTRRIVSVNTKKEKDLADYNSGFLFAESRF